MGLSTIKLCLLLCIFSWTEKTVEGFPNGSPYTSCADRMPHHYVQAQRTPSPFTVTASQNIYTPGAEIKITVSSPDSRDFRGFVMTVNRKTGDTEELLGNFINPPDGVNVVTWYPAVAEEKNCATHSEAIDRKSIEVTWKAPATYQGDLEILTSVATNFTHIWEGIKAPLTAFDQSVKPPPFPQELGSQPASLKFSECGVSQGCFSYPTNCAQSQCQAIVAFKVNETSKEIDFRIEADGSNGVGYVSIGFSDDMKMGSEATITCSADDSGNILNVANGYNPGPFNGRHRITGFKNINLARIDNRISCSFTRPAVLEYFVLSYPAFQPTSPKPNLITESNYMFVALGPLYEGTPSIDKHKIAPLISTSRFSLKEVILVGGSSVHLNIRIHATLALVGWMTLVGLGIILARHYRSVLASMCCGTAVWFNLHRGVMVLGVMSSIGAVVIVFVHVKAWTQSAQIHAILGLTAVGLSLIQVISGMCRPGLDSSNRRYFNWLHRMAGFVSYMVAAATVLLGFNTSQILPDLQRTETIIILVWLAFHVFWDIMLEKFPWKYSKSGPYKVEQNGVSIQERNQPTPSAAPEMFALVLYLLGTSCFLVASLYFLYTA